MVGKSLVFSQNLTLFDRTWGIEIDCATQVRAFLLGENSVDDVDASGLKKLTTDGRLGSSLGRGGRVRLIRIRLY